MTTIAQGERLLTTKQAALVLASEWGIVLSSRTVSRRCDDGMIAHTRTTGGDRRISREALRAFAEQALR